jgi:RNA polymerase sigma-70 factor (ECF subfamily)
VSPALAEPELLTALKAGEARAFEQLVLTHSATLLRLARSVLRDEEAASEVVQDTWLAVLDGVERFEGRATLRTWLCQIALNRARKRAGRDARTVPLEPEDDPVPAERFDEAGKWQAPPRRWAEGPEALALRTEARAAIDRAISALPEGQRLVLTMRDVDGLSGAEVCHVLGLSESNQRQLLHRAREKVRAALEAFDPSR